MPYEQYAYGALMDQSVGMKHVMGGMQQPGQPHMMNPMMAAPQGWSAAGDDEPASMATVPALMASAPPFLATALPFMGAMLTFARADMMQLHRNMGMMHPGAMVLPRSC